MHQSFVTTAPHTTYRDGRGIAGLMCVAVIFRVPPQCRVSAGLVKYTTVEFTIIKSRAMPLSRFPECRAFSRAVSPKVGWGGGRGQCISFSLSPESGK